jgi:hypothetical protein
VIHGAVDNAGEGLLDGPNHYLPGLDPLSQTPCCGCNQGESREADAYLAALQKQAQHGPECFGDTIRSDYAKYGRIVRAIGFKPQ